MAGWRSPAAHLGVSGHGGTGGEQNTIPGHHKGAVNLHPLAITLDRSNRLQRRLERSHGVAGLGDLIPTNGGVTHLGKGNTQAIGYHPPAKIDWEIKTPPALFSNMRCRLGKGNPQTISQNGYHVPAKMDWEIQSVIRIPLESF